MNARHMVIMSVFVCFSVWGFFLYKLADNQSIDVTEQHLTVEELALKLDEELGVLSIEEGLNEAQDKPVPIPSSTQKDEGGMELIGKRLSKREEADLKNDAYLSSAIQIGPAKGTVSINKAIELVR
ncbi:hypothetical protein [Bacillus piscicola]|uniref:hypothetical protein n=1 Tax=Bacillus piscicola TaxID=1632684 RepID=UPI001F093EBA|nr:hypothetical protein [Bacillus piscicola]